MDLQYITGYVIVETYAFVLFLSSVQFQFPVSHQDTFAVGPFSFKNRVTPDAGPTFVLNSDSTYDIVMPVILLAGPVFIHQGLRLLIATILSLHTLQVTMMVSRDKIQRRVGVWSQAHAYTCNINARPDAKYAQQGSPETLPLLDSTPS